MKKPKAPGSINCYVNSPFIFKGQRYTFDGTIKGLVNVALIIGVKQGDTVAASFGLGVWDSYEIYLADNDDRCGGYWAKKIIVKSDKARKRGRTKIRLYRFGNAGATGQRVPLARYFDDENTSEVVVTTHHYNEKEGQHTFWLKSFKAKGGPGWMLQTELDETEFMFHMAQIQQEVDAKCGPYLALSDYIIRGGRPKESVEEGQKADGVAPTRRKGPPIVKLK
jgi:hypothetical protein